MRSVHAPRRTTRGRERGLTLIELLVSIAIVAIIATAIASLFGVGLTLLGPGGAGGGPADRLLGARDVSALEQVLGRDGARAACIQIPAGTTVNGPTTVNHEYGSCGSGYAAAAGGCAGAGFVVCFGWPQVSSSNCQVAAYTTVTVGPNSIPERNSAAETVDSATVTIPSVNTISAPGGYPWVRSLSVSIKPLGIRNGIAISLTLHPVASDPAAVPQSQIVPNGNSATAPC